jgi:nicotinamidase-related amidase
MRILKDQTVAFIIDVQERLFPVIDNNEQLAQNLETLIRGLKILQIPIKVSEQYRKGLGITIASLQPLLQNTTNIEKLAFSCCDTPELMSEIDNKTAKFIILAGIETHICLLQTAIDLKEKGFQPVVVEDCTGSRDPENKRIAIHRMLQEGIIVTSFESLLFELCRYAGTDSFKAISKLVK